MNLIQFLLVVGVVIIAVLGTRALPQDSSLAVKRIIALLFVAGAILAIIFPNALTWTAQLVGVGRGTDLLLYLFIVAALLYVVASERTRARNEAKITELSRAVALMEARIEQRNRDNAS
ncbi:DUF2304 domain-containing protein [Leucobacter sp. M11]|uniref:DUF2304 domain-containing protein n=1 Tax=Leucobacter sp. M11 TaxID=2993565 RepID=UPI002D8036B4|nr:DUF2304 domain-containing protein [Leucobacter sp. M11]MEB4615413.1 DUF2304 domain-containing protein [Leucobacter sp. M11]